MSVPTLTGQRVRLEPLRPDHFEALLPLALDERVFRYMIAWFRTPQDFRLWFDRALNQAAAGIDTPWATVDLATNAVVGSTRLADLDRYHQTAELGHTWLTPTAQGTGVNSEAKFLQLQHAFEDLGLYRVELRTHHLNLRSQAAILKLGAVYEGTFRNHFLMPDGTRRHTKYYSITREDWPQVKSQLEQKLRSAPPAPQLSA